MDRAQGSNALDACKSSHPHLPGRALDRELRSRNRLTFLDPHRATLAVYFPYFITENFVTSQRLEAAPQHHTLQVMVGLPPAVQTCVQERFLGPPPSSYGDNGEEAGAIYCVFVTVTHWDPV